MSIDPSAGVSGVGPGQQAGPPDKAQQSADDRMAIRVFAMLMSILGVNAQAIMHTYLPVLAKEKIWQNAATGVFNIFNINPGTLNKKTGKYDGSQFTNTELGIFAKGWEYLQYAYAHQNSPEWKDMPSNLQNWTKSMMTHPTFTKAFNKLYATIVQLQKLESEGAPKSQTQPLINSIHGQIAAIQALGKSKDKAVAIEYATLKDLTRTAVAAMAALSNLTYAKAIRVINNITSLTKYTSNLIQHLEQVKQRVGRAMLS